MSNFAQKTAAADLASTAVVAGEKRIEAFVTLQVRYQPTERN